MNRSLAFGAVAALPVLVLSLLGLAACKNNDAQDPSQIPNNAGGYNNPQGGYNNPQGGYTATAPPNPLQIIPCSSDAQCVTARCNTAIGRCASPCANTTDCQPGNGCVAGACVPGAL